MDSFFARPIFNSPYAYPGRHWELDGEGQPTNWTVDNNNLGRFGRWAFAEFKEWVYAIA
jgi:hypothetical protein